MKGELSEIEWGKLRLRIENMTAEELSKEEEKGTLARTFGAAVYPNRKYAPRLPASIVNEALRMWKHLAKKGTGAT